MPHFIEPGLHRISLPLVLGELPTVNVYAIEGPAGIFLVDAAVDTSEARAGLREQLRLLGAAPADVQMVFITHPHSDHHGLSRDFKSARIVMLGAPADNESRADGNGWPQESVEAWFGAHGVSPAALLQRRRRNRAATVRITDGVSDGAVLRWHHRNLTVIATPGHSPKHACLFDAEAGLLFSGDHVLEEISPHLGLMADEPGNPLGEYLLSLDRVRVLGVRLVLPGHGVPFEGLISRVDELKYHHSLRTAEILAAVRGGAHAVVDIAREVTWLDRQDGWSILDEASQGMAISETLAHLRYLQRLGVVERQKRNGIYEYITVDSATGLESAVGAD